MKAKNNTVITVSIVLLVLSGYFLANGIYQQNKILDETLRNEEKHIDTIIGSILKYSLAPYLTRIQHIELAHPDIIKAFANRDREKLYATASHEFHVLQQENEYFHAMDFTLPDGTVFMRVQRPDLHGDNINKSRKIVQHVQLTQKTAAGFDIGKHGAIYWIAQPLQIDGKQIGTMEFGISINLFTDAIRQRLHNEVTIAIKSSEWEKATFGTQNIHKIGDYYLMTEGRNLYNKFPANFDFDAKHHQAVIDNIDNLVHSRANIRDYSGNPIGKIVVLQDISKEIASKKNFVIQSILIASFLVGSALLIIYLTIHHLVGKLEKYADKNRQANEELLSNHDELERLIVNRTSELAQANAVLHQEITDRSKAEKTNLDQREFLQNIIESLTNPFYVFDAETYEITLANKAAYALTDRPKEGLTCHAMTHNSDTPCSGDEHICALAEVKMTKRPVRVEHIHCNSAGDGRYYEVYAYPIFDRDGKITQIIEYNIDITERKKIEEEKSKIWSQLLQSQKMEAVGMLAGGVAHDFNNILTSIIGNVQLANLKSGNDNTTGVDKHLDQIMKSANRAVDLVRQLLLFSRKQSTEDEYPPTDINKTIQNTLEMLNRLLGEDITITTDLASDIDMIRADKGNIEQMLTNLAVNARDAMPNGGEINISTKNISIEKSCDKQISKAKANNYVAISVTDTGIGINKEDLPHIFDPFFSTKPEGKGTGLGLSIVYGIAKQHGGWVKAYSELGKGTIFHIYLPKTSETEEKTPPSSIPTTQQQPELVGENRLILLIEDEKDVRDIVIKILENKGFRIISAEDIETARTIYKEEKENIDLVFSDVALPDGNGVQLAQEFLAETPDMKILMTSGYPDHRSRLSDIHLQKLQFIQKPYGVDELTQAISKVLSTK